MGLKEVEEVMVINCRGMIEADTDHTLVSIKQQKFDQINKRQTEVLCICVCLCMCFGIFTYYS